MLLVQYSQCGTLHKHLLYNQTEVDWYYYRIPRLPYHIKLWFRIHQLSVLMEDRIDCEENK